MRLESDGPLQLLRCATNALAPAGRNIVRATRSMANGWRKARGQSDCRGGGVNLWLDRDRRICVLCDRWVTGA